MFFFFSLVIWKRKGAWKLFKSRSLEIDQIFSEKHLRDYYINLGGISVFWGSPQICNLFYFTDWLLCFQNDFKPSNQFTVCPLKIYYVRESFLLFLTLKFNFRVPYSQSSQHNHIFSVILSDLVQISFSQIILNTALLQYSQHFVNFLFFIYHVNYFLIYIFLPS